MNSKIIAIGVIALGIIGFAALQFTGSKKPQDTTAQQSTNTAITTSQTEVVQTSTSQNSTYKNGTYTATGAYKAPPGEEKVTVTLTLEDGVVTDSSLVKLGKHEISKKMQTNFESGYKEFVIGKNIDEIDLDVVAGSSLTPNGFENALEQIKQEASS